MGASKRYLREQFSWTKFTLEHYDETNFYLSCLQRNRSPLPLLLIRLLVFLGCVAILVTSLTIRVEESYSFWFIYMTNWGLILIVFASALALAVSVRYYFKGPIDSSLGLPCYLKLHWAVYNTAITIGFFITIFYYSLLYNLVAGDNTDWNPVLDLFVHGINSVLMFLMLVTSQQPSQILHFIYPVTFALIYTAFSIIFFYAGGVNSSGEPWIYPLLDWSNPGLTTGVVAACAGFIIVLHWFVVLLSLLRDYLSRRYIKNFSILTFNA